MLKIYDYYCHDCEIATERLVEDKDQAKERCELCDQLLSKLISAPSGYVKGSSNPVDQRKNRG